MERKKNMKSKPIKPKTKTKSIKSKQNKATNENNNIININLGKEVHEYIKHTEKIKTEKIKNEPKPKAPEIDDSLYADELKEIISVYNNLKNQAVNSGIILPENLTIIPSTNMNIKNVNDIIALTNYIKMLIKEIQEFIKNYKQTTQTQTTTQTTTQGQTQTTTQGRPFAYPQRASYNYTQPYQSPYNYNYQIGIPPITPARPPARPPPATPAKPPITPATPARPPPATPAPITPDTEPPKYEPDILTASNLQKAENIKLYYNLPTNYPPTKTNDEFLIKIKNDIMTLQNLAVTSINLVIKNKIYQIRKDLLIIRQNYIDSIKQTKPTEPTEPTKPTKPIPNQDKITQLNVRGKFLSNYLTTLNNNNINVKLLSFVDKQTRARIGEIVNLINRITMSGENPNIENVMIADLYADKGSIEALNAFNSLEEAKITDFGMDTYFKYINKIQLTQVPNTIRYELTIDNNKYNQVFDSNGNLMTIEVEPLTEPQEGDTVHIPDPNDTREEQIQKAVQAQNEHCDNGAKQSKAFWMSSAGPDGAAFYQANDCATKAEKGAIAGITRFFEKYSVPFTPKRQAPTSNPSQDRGGGFFTPPIP